MIPRIAHFVFGLREQDEPFSFLHYAALESCRRVLAPEAIHLHHRHLPWGPWWDRIEPHLTLSEVDLVGEVLDADYSSGLVPTQYRYAHHSDFIRLDALIEHGGVYADIDTIFLRAFPDELFGEQFVIGREPPVRDERTGRGRASLCNALLIAAPGAAFAREWRAGMAAALDGSWSNHSGFLSEELSLRRAAEVTIRPQSTFFPIPPTIDGLADLLERRVELAPEALSLHLWSHLWWERQRWDFSVVHGGHCRPSFLRSARSTLAELVRAYIPDDWPAGGSPLTPDARPVARARVPDAGRPARPRRAGVQGPARPQWRYMSFDTLSGYGIAAERAMAALEDSGLMIAWTPFVEGWGWELGHEPLAAASGFDRDRVVIAHLPPEYLPRIRSRAPEALLVAHTVWDTDRLPAHWAGCLDHADLLVVPSRFSAEVVERSEVRVPIAVVPHVAAPAPRRRPGGSWLDAIPEDVAVFYTIAEWNERKAVFHTIEAYLRAFDGRDRVLLIVKTSPDDRRVAAPVAPSAAGPGTTALSVARLLAAHRDPPPLRLLTHDLPQWEIEALHQRGDCFVSLARCEGWGLGAFDAAAAGNPVVTTGYGGQLDFLTGTPHLVDFKLVAVEDPVGSASYTPDQRWAEPDLDHAASLLAELAGDRHGAGAAAQPIAAGIRRHYRPEVVASAFRAAVASVAGATSPPARRVPPLS